MPKHSVFISATRKDLREYVDLAREAVSHAGFAAEMQEYFPPEGKRSLPACLDKVAAADVVIVIVAHRYGWVPADQDGADGDVDRSITWLECAHAIKHGKVVLAYVVDDAVPWPHEFREGYRLAEAAEQGTSTPDLQSEVQRNIQRLKDFKAWLDLRITARFSAKEDFVMRVGAGLKAAAERLPRIDGNDGNNETGREEPPSRTTIPAAYMDWLTRECQDIELLGLDLKQQQATMLRSVYVPLVTSVTRVAAEPDESPANILREQEEAPARVLDRLNEQSLYLVGDAGTGKSTFCRWVTWLVCTGAMPEHAVPVPEELAESEPAQLSGRLPVLVRLRDLWLHLPLVPGVHQMGADGLMQGLESYLKLCGPEPLRREALAAQLAQGRVLLVLDGLDEVPVRTGAGEQVLQPRACLLAALAAVLKPWQNAGNRVLLTSRPYALEHADVRKLALEETLIAGLPSALRELFVQRWFHAIGKPDTAAALLAEVQSRDDIVELLQAPVLLTALCVVYGEGGRLPDEKYDLYARVVNRVLFNRYDDSVEVEKVRARLAVVAHAMHTGHWLNETRTTPQFGIGDQELDHVLQHYRQENPAVEQGVENAVIARSELLTRSGLLTAREQGAAFYHPSFQEFLAGDWMLYRQSNPGEDLTAVFLRHGNTPEWRNTLGFLFGALIHAFSRNANRALDLLNGLVGELDPARIEDCHPLAVVVADCLEMIERKSAPMDEQMHARFRAVCLAGIGHQAPVAVPVRARQSLGLALGRMGDPRIHGPQDRAGYIEVPAGDYPYQDDEVVTIANPFALGRYPVTNDQYRLFMEAGGYELDGPWWSAEGRTWLQDEKVTEPLYWRQPRFNAVNQPVVGVSWFEAQAFCAWAGGRLPSEHEWEAAARGPAGLTYPWGAEDTWVDGICNSREAGLGGTSVVGLFPGSRQVDFGFEDMAGNVWEWSADLRNDTYPSLRGGSWGDASRVVRAAFRNYLPPVNRVSYVGFRVLLSTRQD